MATIDVRQPTVFSRLRGLVEVTRLVRTGESLPDLLWAISRTISDSLGFRTVVINLYRPEWDDFIVSTVFGSDDARATLAGQIQQFSDWEPLLDERFLQRGAYLILNGEFEWGDTLAYTPDLPVNQDPASWHPEDALFAPMRSSDGSLLGIVSVDEPISGLRPAGDELDVLVAVSEHAALVVQSAQEAARAQANRDALQHLLAVSAKLNESEDAETLLEAVCTAVSEALGFERVAVQLLRDDGGHDTAACLGFPPDHLEHFVPLTAEQLDLLLQPKYEIAGCYLLRHDDACKLLPDRGSVYRSRRDGRGPRAWQNDWLLVPMHSRRGARIGYIWTDDPVDRLRPEPERLQALRAFANQATTALEHAAQVEALANANEHQRALIEASPAAIIDFDFEGRIRSWNQAATSIFGWRAEDVIGHVNVTVPHGGFAAFLSELRRVKAGETVRDIDTRRRHRDGSEIDVSISRGPIRDSRGEIVGCIGVATDVSARKRSERAVAASEARKDAILQASLDPVIVVDAEGVIVEVNPATEETLGVPRADAVGKPFLEVAVAPEHRADLAQVLASGGGPLLGTRLEITALRVDRRPFPAEIAITRVALPGEPLFVVSLHDVTRRHEREQRLLEAEATYRTLVERIPLVTYINEIDFPVRTLYISPQVEAMLGYPAADWLEPDFFPTILFPADRERVLAEVERTHLKGEDFKLEYRLVAADGRVVWVRDQTVGVRDGNYRPIRLQGFMVDVTDLHAPDTVDF